MAVESGICDFGWPAPDFVLKGTDGKLWRLTDVRGPRGTLVMFICNHCPYVKGAIERIVRDARELDALGIRSVAIMPNDTEAYPEDDFDYMVAFAKAHQMPFPYLIDETQSVAKAYDAKCTPDFFGFDRDLRLQYRGRIDIGGKNVVPGARRDLFEAMKQIAESGQGPREQVPSIGCSVKWRR